MIGKYFSLVKFSHTIFAMPFALMGYFIGIHTPGFGFEWRTLLLVLLCMIFARSAAMGFNRYVDRKIDARNQRTLIREIPSGIVSARSALVFVLVNAILFVLTTAFINPICFYLSPLALLIILAYSYTKIFPALCHINLGLGLMKAVVSTNKMALTRTKTSAFLALTIPLGISLMSVR